MSIECTEALKVCALQADIDQMWVQNTHILLFCRDNILFGREFEHERYSAALKDSILHADIDCAPCKQEMTGCGCSAGTTFCLGRIFSRTEVLIACALQADTDQMQLLCRDNVLFGKEFQYGVPV